jgi:Xaa-Pro aminopeptidase
MDRELQSRLARFRDSLTAAGLDGAVVGKPENVFYLTGVSAGPDRPRFAVIGPSRGAVVAPSGCKPSSEFAPFPYGVPGGIVDRIVDIEMESVDALVAALAHAELRGRRVGVEVGAVSSLHTSALDCAALVPLHDEVEALRRRLGSDELLLVREAIRCNEAGFAAALATIREGVSEFEVFLAVSRAIQEAAGVGLSLNDGNHAFLSGPRTALVAGPATDRRLRAGDLMIIDVNPPIRHYKGDLARTFCVGEPSATQRDMHDALVRALDRAIEVVRPGDRGLDVDAAMREVLIASGYGDGVITHLGHGLGLQHPERPYIIPAEDMRIEEGMVLALEPGIYWPNGVGLRIEDNYLVTAQGLESLSQFPRDLIVCGV